MKFIYKYLESDLEAGLQFGGDFDADQVLFMDFGISTQYLDLLESLKSGTTSLTKYPIGFGVNKDKTELLSILNSIIPHSRWETLIEQLEQGNLNPVISINNKMIDGAHRVILCYLLNEPVLIALFKAPYVDWSNTF